MVHSTAEVTAVKAIARAAGLSLICPDCQWLSRGVNSSAWRVDCLTGSYAVRLHRTSAWRAPTYFSESLLSAQLVRLGPPVPKPIANNVTYRGHIAGVTRAWSVATLADGQAISSRGLDTTLAQELARFLAVLHSIDVEGYGPLAQDSDRLRGIVATPMSGLLARWRSAALWPLDGSDLSEHPIAAFRPDLARAVEKHREAIVAAATREQRAVLHSDIHADHVYAQDGHLSTVLDFGGAFVGPISWDFAPVALFLGWDQARSLVREYNALTRSSLAWHDLTRVTLCFVLYRFAVEATASAPAYILERHSAVLAETLNLAPPATRKTAASRDRWRQRGSSISCCGSHRFRLGTCTPATSAFATTGSGGLLSRESGIRPRRCYIPTGSSVIRRSSTCFTCISDLVEYQCSSCVLQWVP